MMAHIDVLFVRGYREIEPTSTTIFSDGLIRALRKYAPGGIVVEEFIPKPIFPSLLKSPWGIRFARFIIYPFQVPRSSKKITHILDHGCAHSLYFRQPDKSIVTVTDLMPILWWKGLLPVKTKKRLPATVLYSLYALKRARHIITISSNTKNDLVQLIGCDPAKISVVYLGVDEIFRPYDTAIKSSLRERWFGSEQKKVILITGSQFYKNHEIALETFSSLLANGLDNIYLVKTGDLTHDWIDLVKKYGLEQHVMNIGFIPREQMPDLYNAIDLLFFPSLYEGFGWPPLEAMACGTPAVTSNAASLPEVMGNLDTMCTPFDIIGFNKKIQILLTDEDYRQRIIQEGLVQSANFTWDKTAHQILSIYESVSNYLLGSA